jgi:hypothetical protein
MRRRHASADKETPMNRALTIAPILAASTSTALAQLGTGLVTWEANDGSGWTSGRLETTAPSVEVRVKAAWFPAQQAAGFAGMQFDTLVISPVGSSDAVDEPRRLRRFATATSQTIVASRFSNTIKIDDSRDTLPPGIGARGVFPGQLVPPFWDDFSSDRSNPALLFTFRLIFDTTPGVRTIDSLYLAPAGGDTISRYMRLYTGQGGFQITPNTSTQPLEIVYIPAPGTALFAALTSIPICSRRRR